MRQDDEERELQVLLRNVAALVLLGLFVLMVVVILVTPFVTDRTVDTTLLLGLAASVVGAMLTLLGVQVSIDRKRNGK
jgi:hypothetical protein